MYLPFDIPNNEGVGLLTFAAALCFVCVIAASDWHFMRFHPWIDGYMLSLFPAIGTRGRKHLFRCAVILVISALLTVSVFSLLFQVGVFIGPEQFRATEQYVQ